MSKNSDVSIFPSRLHSSLSVSRFRKFPCPFQKNQIMYLGTTFLKLEFVLNQMCFMQLMAGRDNVNSLKKVYDAFSKNSYNYPTLLPSHISFLEKKWRTVVVLYIDAGRLSPLLLTSYSANNLRGWPRFSNPPLLLPSRRRW